MTDLTKPKKTGRKGKETEHLKALRLGCEAYECFGYKIPDLPIKLQSPKPFDMILSVFGVSVAVEAKFRSDTNKIGGSDLSESQRNGLRNHADSGGVSLLVNFLHLPGSDPEMYWFNWYELAASRRFECSPSARPNRIQAVRKKEMKTGPTGKVRAEYRWHYDVWPFLKDCTDSFARRLSHREKGSGAELALGRSLQFYSPGLAEPRLSLD